jgi:hypothetical protein
VTPPDHILAFNDDGSVECRPVCCTDDIPECYAEDESATCDCDTSECEAEPDCPDNRWATNDGECVTPRCPGASSIMTPTSAEFGCDEEDAGPCPACVEMASSAAAPVGDPKPQVQPDPRNTKEAFMTASLNLRTCFRNP